MPLNAQSEVRVEEARTMIRSNVTAGDILRYFKKKYGVHVRTAQRYVTWANRRNLSALGMSEDEALAATLAWWSRKQHEAEGVSQKEGQRMEQASVTLSEIDAALVKTDEDTPEKELEVLYRRQQIALRQQESSRRAKYGAEQTCKECQEHIDRLRGNLAPIKVARTNSKGQDIEKMTLEERTQELLKLGIQPFKGLPIVTEFTDGETA